MFVSSCEVCSPTEREDQPADPLGEEEGEKPLKLEEIIDAENFQKTAAQCVFWFINVEICDLPIKIATHISHGHYDRKVVWPQ